MTGAGSALRRPLPRPLRLLTGVLLTGLMTQGGLYWQRQAILAHLGAGVARVMLAHGVRDGAAAWSNDDGWTFRTARLSGSADAATRAQIIAEVAARPGVHAAVWR